MSHLSLDHLLALLNARRRISDLCSDSVQCIPSTSYTQVNSVTSNEIYTRVNRKRIAILTFENGLTHPLNSMALGSYWSSFYTTQMDVKEDTFFQDFSSFRAVMSELAEQDPYQCWVGKWPYVVKILFFLFKFTLCCLQDITQVRSVELADFQELSPAPNMKYLITQFPFKLALCSRGQSKKWTNLNCNEMFCRFKKNICLLPLTLPYLVLFESQIILCWGQWICFLVNSTQVTANMLLWLVWGWVRSLGTLSNYLHGPTPKVCDGAYFGEWYGRKKVPTKGKQK